MVVPAGRTSGQIAVGVKGDTKPEGDEAFVVRLTGATFATIADAEAVVHDPRRRHDASGPAVT